MNFVFVAGHLGADAEERFTANGKRVVSLRLASRIRQGGKDDTIWWRVNIWSDRFDKMIPYLRKGSALIVVGELGKPETYVDKEGNTRVSLTISAESIKFSPFGKPASTQENSALAGGAPAAAEPFASVGSNVNAGEQPANANETVGDDLPF